MITSSQGWTPGRRESGAGATVNELPAGALSHRHLRHISRQGWTHVGVPRMRDAGLVSRSLGLA
jgi:hypothetical protein